MPLVVPVHNPSRVISATLGNFFGGEGQYLVVATLASLQFFDESFNLHSFSIPIGSPVASIGSIKTTDRDGIVLCLANGNVHVITCEVSQQDNTLQVSKQLVFTNKPGKRPFEFICSNPSKSISLLKGDPSHLYTLRAGKTVKFNAHGGRWGKIIDACYLDDEKICLLENDPATSPQLAFYSLKSKSLVMESKYPLTSLDFYNQLRICPVNDGVLVYDFENIEKYTVEGEKTHVANMCAFSIAKTANSGALVTERGGVVHDYNTIDGDLKAIGKLEVSPVNMIISGNLVFSWGNGQPTQVFEISPTVQLSRTLSTLGPVQEILPYFEERPAKVMAFTSSVFDFENYDKCFSTLSRIDFGASALNLASVATPSVMYTNILTLEQSIFAFSSETETVVYESDGDGLIELESYEHYSMNFKTLAGDQRVQISPQFIKTSTNTVNQQVSCAAIYRDSVFVAYLNELRIYSIELKLLHSITVEKHITLIKALNGYTFWATSTHLYIAQSGDVESARELPIGDISDISLIGDDIFLGTNKGKIHLLQKYQVAHTISILSAPITFCCIGNAVLVIANKVVRIYKEGNNAADFSYELIQFNRPVSLLASLSDNILLTTREGNLDIWMIEDSSANSITTVGTHESIDVMVKFGKDLITASRDEKEYAKCHLVEWSNGLRSSELLRTLLKPDELIESAILLQFDGFSGILLGVNHIMKNECQLILLNLNDLEKEPQVINVGVGMIVRMIPRDSLVQDTAEVYLLNSNFMGLISFKKSGAKITVFDTPVRSGSSFDIYGNDLLLLDFFERAELCKVSDTTLHHRLWFDDTQETMSGIILPATKTIPETSYLISTDSSALHEFEIWEDQVSGKSFEFMDKVTCMTRLSYDTDAPFFADALLGTGNGGLFAYFRLPSSAEKSLALLSRRAKALQASLFNEHEEDSSLIFWPDISNLDASQLSRLCDELDINKFLVEQAKESIKSFMY